MNEQERIRECFCAFIEGSLVSHDNNSVLKLFADDVMGIGMGAQGIVRCKEDLRPILLNTRNGVDDSKTEIQYSNMQIRYYGDDYASICATVTILTKIKDEQFKSHIGQCASMRRIEGAWKMIMVQATPLSINIQDIEAYPLSFAEDEIETYRMHEQFSNIMRRNIIATYKIDFELGEFEDYAPTEKYSTPVTRGDRYETVIFALANEKLDGKMRLKFIETFSIDHLSKCYHNGITDLSLDLEILHPDGKKLWQRNSLHLFTDIKGHLKGYLYLFDIDREKRQELKLIGQAELDLATDVYNKGTVRQKVELALSLYGKSGTCAFFMIDLDYFKHINDTYGHAIGDYVIRKTADGLKKIFREEDIIGRFGGDEFCVFYTGKNSDEILSQKAKQICEVIRSIRFGNDGEEGCSASIGIARRTEEDDFDSICHKADVALYLSKNQKGRDDFTIYQEN